MRGRQSKELQAAVDWIKIKLSHGTLLSKDARIAAPASWRTMCRAKKALGLVSKQTPDGWIWLYPSAKPVAQRIETKVEDMEEEYVPQMTTQSMIECANGLLSDGKSLSDIIKELVLSCADWPMPKPYSKAYIESVARHVVEDTAIASHLNENKE